MKSKLPSFDKIEVTKKTVDKAVNETYLPQKVSISDCKTLIL